MIKKEKKDLFFSELTGKSLAIGGLVFIILSFFIFIIFGSWKFSTTLNEGIIGQYGDLIGGVIGSIFSLTSVILFYVSLKEQRKEIGKNQNGVELQIKALNDQVIEFRAQKEEMQETRNVYNEQTKEFKRQTDIAKLQQFDSSFYSLLNLFINLNRELNNKDVNNNYFFTIYSKFKDVNIKDKDLSEVYESIIIKYIEVFYENYNELTHYLKTVYRIINLIDKSNIDEFEKFHYAKIFRSQLTENELLVLYYNYYSLFGEKVRPLVKKYNLFKHLQVLDRIEFGFDGDYKMKSKLTSYIHSLSILISTNFEKSNDIGVTSDINISESKEFLDFESEISLLIDVGFELIISFKKDVWLNQKIFDREFIKKYILMSIYDVLFLSKYKIPDTDIIAVEYIESVKNFKIKFTINNIQDI